MCSVVNVLFKVNVEFTRGPNMTRKKLREQTVFGLLGLQANLVTKQLKITHSFTYKYMVIPHTYKGKRNFRKDKKKLFTHILPTPIQHNPSTIPLVIFIVPLSFPGAAICKKKMYEKKIDLKKGNKPNCLR